MFSKIFGTQFPGNGCIYLEQSSRFIKPVFLDDVVIARVEITAIDENKGFLYFSTECKVNNIVVITGQATIYIGKE